MRPHFGSFKSLCLPAAPREFLEVPVCARCEQRGGAMAPPHGRTPHRSLSPGVRRFTAGDAAVPLQRLAAPGAARRASSPRRGDVASAQSSRGRSPAPRSPVVEFPWLAALPDVHFSPASTGVSPCAPPTAETLARFRIALQAHAADRRRTEAAAAAWLEQAVPRGPCASPSPRQPADNGARDAACCTPASAAPVVRRTPLAPLTGLLNGAADSRGGVAAWRPDAAEEQCSRQPSTARADDGDAAPTPTATPLSATPATPARTPASPGLSPASLPATPLPALLRAWRGDKAAAMLREWAALARRLNCVADAADAARRARTALRAWRRALPLLARARMLRALAARTHRQRAVRGAWTAWRAAAVLLRRRRAALLVWRMRDFPARAGASLRAWAAVARAAFLTRDQYGAAAAMARQVRLSRALLQWRAAAASRAARLELLQLWLRRWRAATACAAEEPRACLRMARLRRCLRAWSAIATGGEHQGARRARAAAALTALKGATVRLFYYLLRAPAGWR